MLKNLTVRGFKSLKDVTVDFPRMAVLFGPNAAGKSNLLDAIQALSRIGTQRTLADALSEPIRGYPIEAFSFPPGGLADLLSSSSPHFSLEANLTREKDAYRYRVDVEIAPGSGTLAVADEYLSALAKDGSPKGMAAIERIEGNLRVRRKNESGKPRYERLGQNYAILSDPRLGVPQYPLIEGARLELSGWRTYYLDPRVAMRAAQPPSDVQDIGVLGGEVALRVRSARGGHGRAIQELKLYQRIVAKGTGYIPCPALLIVGIDGNCATFTKAKKEMQNATDASFQDRLVVACPDPHVERWYLADPDSFESVIGHRHTVGRKKCARDYYKDALAKAVRQAGHPPTLGGIEFAQEIVSGMDYFARARMVCETGCTCSRRRAPVR
ncbi:MAG: AAA family ATPase [Gammaproteobacteria bacterium]